MVFLFFFFYYYCRPILLPQASDFPGAKRVTLNPPGKVAMRVKITPHCVKKEKKENVETDLVLLIFFCFFRVMTVMTKYAFLI